VVLMLLSLLLLVAAAVAIVAAVVVRVVVRIDPPNTVVLVLTQAAVAVNPALTKQSTMMMFRGESERKDCADSRNHYHRYHCWVKE